MPDWVAWESRLRRFNRAALFALDLGESAMLVLFFAVLGSMAGAKSGAGWIGMGAGAVLGGTGGVVLAKRFFFEKTRPLVTLPLAEIVRGAYRWPGVEEQFARARKRMVVPVLLMASAFLFLSYLGIADEQDWPVPSAVPLHRLVWGLVLFEILMLLLLRMNARCPKCRRFLARFAELRQCPHCLVVLR